MGRIAEEKHMARVRAYEEIQELIKSGSDEELAARIRQAAAEKSELFFFDAYGYSILHVAAENNRAEASALLVQEAGFDVDIRSNFNRTPLHAAATLGAAQAAQTLISLGAELDARDGDGNTPMQRAACYAKETDDKNFDAIKVVAAAGPTRPEKAGFLLDPINGSGTEQAQRRFLSLSGEERDELPPRFMFICDFYGQTILVVRDESISYGEFDG